MVSWSCKAVAVAWSVACMYSSAITFEEYSPMYLKQLGFNATQIGLTTGFGIPALLVPLLAGLCDRYRTRKIVLVLSFVTLALLTLAPLLPPYIKEFQVCQFKSHVRSSNETVHEWNSSRVENISTTIEGNSNFSNQSSFSVSRNQRFLSRVNDSPGVSQAVEDINRNDSLVLSSSTFVFIASVKITYEFAVRTATTLCNVAIMTYLKNNKANYGSIICVGQIAAALSLFVTGLMASQIDGLICGILGHGYYVTFPWAALIMTMAPCGTLWMKFEYLEHRVIDWSDVNSVFGKAHYIFVLFIAFYFGCCFSFQLYWEFWYIAHLSGSPSLMGTAGLVRRPFATLWYLSSTKAIGKLGELQTMVFSLFVYAVCQFSLSVIQSPWMVVVIDVFQSAAFAYSYTSLTIHFTKAWSKASSAFILGVSDTAFALGMECGATSFGLLFGAFGERTTLLSYGIASGTFFVLFTAYLYGNKDVYEYEKVPASDDE